MDPYNTTIAKKSAVIGSTIMAAGARNKQRASIRSSEVPQRDLPAITATGNPWSESGGSGI